MATVESEGPQQVRGTNEKTLSASVVDAEILCSADGEVRYTSLESGTSCWKKGNLQVGVKSTGQWICILNNGIGSPRSFKLTNNVKGITKVTSNPGRITLALKDGTNISLNQGNLQEVQRLNDLVDDIKNAKSGGATVRTCLANNKTRVQLVCDDEESWEEQRLDALPAKKQKVAAAESEGPQQERGTHEKGVLTTLSASFADTKIMCSVDGEVRYTSLEQGMSNWKEGNLQVGVKSTGQCICILNFKIGCSLSFRLTNNVRGINKVTSNPGRIMLAMKDGACVSLNKGNLQEVQRLSGLLDDIKNTNSGGSTVEMCLANYRNGVQLACIDEESMEVHREFNAKKRKIAAVESKGRQQERGTHEKELKTMSPIVADTNILCSAHGEVRYTSLESGTAPWKKGNLQVGVKGTGQCICILNFKIGPPRSFKLNNNVRGITAIASNPGIITLALKDGTNISLNKGNIQEVQRLRGFLYNIKNVKTAMEPDVKWKKKGKRRGGKRCCVSTCDHCTSDDGNQYTVYGIQSSGRSSQTESRWRNFISSSRGLGNFDQKNAITCYVCDGHFSEDSFVKNQVFRFNTGLRRFGQVKTGTSSHSLQKTQYTRRNDVFTRGAQCAR